MKTILVIEDDDDIVDTVQVILYLQGYEVISSATVLPLNEIFILNPALILLDHYLGDSLGGDLCAQLKQSKVLSKIPVILFSAAPDLASIAQKANADAFVPKPFEVDDLEEKITRLLNIPQPPALS